MDVTRAVKGRRSTRCFRPDEVSGNIIRDILDAARWAPSWGNTQPWEFYVVTGSALEKFEKLNCQQYMDGVPPSPEIPMPKVWPEVLKKRYVSLGKRLLTSMSIAREDKEGRSRYYASMYNLFGAPCLILTCFNKSLSIEYAMLDVGLINQTICLLAHERNLGTCMLAASVSYPKLLRELLLIPEDKIIVIGTLLGYPDWDSPENHFERERAATDQQVTWVR
jgi:nitroreductase